MEESFRQITRWSGQGFGLAISINVTARTLQATGFVEHLSSLLACYSSVEPCRCELEILETAALDDIAHVSRVLQSCNNLGVRFALDDFGTGYSSLTYLRRLPIEVLKIDQSFVRDMLEDQGDLAIVEGVIGLSRAFRRQVVAEGVETMAHGSLLLRLGCDMAQGYGIAHPMSAVEIPEWVKRWRFPEGWLNTKQLETRNP